LEKLEAENVRVVNAVPIVRWNQDKRYLQELEQRGFPIEPTVWLEPGTSIKLRTLLDRQGWGEAVIKPAVSASAYGTWRVTRAGGADDQDRLERLLDRGTVMVQRLNPFIRTTGEWSFVFFGGQYSHAILKTPAPNEFRIQEKLGGRVRGAEPPSPMVHLAKQVVEAIPGDAVYARVDGIADSSQLTVMEVELIEPSLFLGFSPDSPIRFADRLAAELDGGG
jgi:glutathione synthase/RimK-type ligase-like ATP-grasp enzyme